MVSKIKFLSSIVCVAIITVATNLWAADESKVTKNKVTEPKIEQVKAKDVANVSKEEQVNINTADLAKLQTLSGVGAAKAQAIIDFRTQNGNFKNADELLAVPGIGPNTIEKNRLKIILE